MSKKIQIRSRSISPIRKNQNKQRKHSERSPCNYDSEDEIRSPQNAKRPKKNNNKNNNNYNWSRFTVNNKNTNNKNTNNKYHITKPISTTFNKTDVKGKISSKSSKSSSNTSLLSAETPPPKKKEQDTYQTMLPFTSINMKRIKTDFKFKLANNVDYKSKQRKIRIIEKSIRNLNSEKKETEEQNEDENENESKIDEYQNELKQLEKQKEKIEQKVLYKMILYGKYYLIRFSGDINAAILNIYNMINEQSKELSEIPRSNNMRRSLTLKELIKYSIQLKDSIKLIKSIKEQGKAHEKYTKLQQNLDSKVTDGYCSQQVRNYVLTAASLFIKLIQNENNKFGYDIDEEYQKIFIGHIKHFERERFNNEYNHNPETYPPLRSIITPVVTVTTWDTLKHTIDFKDEVKEENDDSDLEISVSISIEPFKVS